MDHVILINPSKQGANIGVNGYGSEKYNAHIIGFRVKDILEDNGGFQKVFCTPGSMTLAEGIQFSNSCQATVHVDIHSNANDGGNRGCQAIYLSGKGKELANAIYTEVSKVSPNNDEGLKYRTDLGALNQTHAVAALVEMFYHDNYDDVAFYKAHKEEYAQAIARGIMNYCGVKQRLVDVYKRVTSTILHVRSTPHAGSNENIIGHLKKDTIVHVGFAENGWANIYFGKEGGWVSEKYLI